MAGCLVALAACGGDAAVDGGVIDGGGLDASTGAEDAATSDDDAATSEEDAAVGDDAASLADAGASTSDAAALDAGTGLCSGAAGRTVRVLFIGNSQIEVNDLPLIIEQLAASAPAACPRITTSRFTMGGANLRDLLAATISGRRLSQVIAAGDYDVAVIAESIDLAAYTPDPFPAQFYEDARTIIDAVERAGRRPILYATPYVEQPNHEGFQAMYMPQRELADEYSLTVAASGLAWIRVWADEPSLDLYYSASDRGHPNYRGSYISAATLYAAVLDATPIGLRNDVEIYCDTGPCPTISTADALRYQTAAWQTHLAVNHAE